MAGSIKPVNYTTDGGIPLGIRMDESNVESVAGAAATIVAAGSPLIGDAKDCRYALYRNAALNLTRKFIVPTVAALAGLPVTVNLYVSTGAGTGGAQPFTLVGTRGEKFPRSSGTDTGLTDGDPT